MALRFNVCLSLFLLLNVSESYANSVVRKPVCEWYQKAEVLFVGTATNISKETYSSARVRFSVRETFKGVSTPDPEFVCSGLVLIGVGVDFKTGEDYFVAAYRDENGLLTIGACDLATHSNSVVADVKFLRSLDKPNRPKTLIYGTVSQLEESGSNKDPEFRALVGMPIQLIGPLGVVKAVSDSDGYFEFLNVPAGKYSVKPLPSRAIKLAPREVTVGSSGCAATSFVAYKKQ